MAIRHLENEKAPFVVNRAVHGGIRHLENQKLYGKTRYAGSWRYAI